MDENGSAGKVTNPKKSLASLFPKRESIETSLGTMYPRWVQTRDLATFAPFAEPKATKKSIDLGALGELALKHLVNRTPDRDDHAGLDDSTFTSLTGEDVRVLAEGVAKACKAGPLAGDDPFKALGSAMFDALSAQLMRLF